MPDAPLTPVAAAAAINQLIVDLWLATERGGPQYDQFNLTAQQHTVLALIVSRPELSPAALAENLGITKGAVSQHLTALESAGYITRRRSETDGRRQIIELTALGEQYRQSIESYERYLADAYTRSLSASDLDEIIAALTKLRDAVESSG